MKILYPSIHYYSYKKKPYCAYYKDGWTLENKQKYFSTHEEAELFLSNYNNKIKNELNIIIKNTIPKQDIKFSKNVSKITIKELLILYINSLSNESTKKSISYHAKQIISIYGDKYAELFTPHDVYRFLKLQEYRNIKYLTAFSRIRILKTAFNYAYKLKIISNNNLQNCKLKTPNYRRINPPSIKEIQQMYNVAPQHIQRVILLGISTGIRVGPSELFRLRWCDIDFDNNIINVPNANKGANIECREVPIKDEIKDILINWYDQDKKNGNNYIISYKNKPVKNITKCWRSVVLKANINRKIRPYDLRHAFASLALMYGGDLKCVSELLGHTDTNMLLKTYQHTTYEMRKDTINNIPNIFILDDSEHVLMNQKKDEKINSNTNLINQLSILLEFVKNSPNIVELIK